MLLPALQVQTNLSQVTLNLQSRHAQYVFSSEELQSPRVQLEEFPSMHLLLTTSRDALLAGVGTHFEKYSRLQDQIEKDVKKSEDSTMRNGGRPEQKNRSGRK